MLPGLIMPARRPLYLAGGAPFSMDFQTASEAEINAAFDCTADANRWRITAGASYERMSANVIRKEHTAAGVARGMFVEPGSANLYTHTDDFANAAWEKNLVAITSDDIAAPDGSANGDKWVETGTGTHEVVEFVTLSGAGRVILSMLGKPDERNSLEYVLFGGGYCAASVDFSDASTFANGNDGGGQFTDLQIGGEVLMGGWVRNWMAVTCGATAAGNLGLAIKIYSGDGGGSTNYAATAGAGLHSWGIMLEEVAAGVDTPSSVILSGAAATTRAAEVVSITTAAAGAANGDTLRLTDENDIVTNVPFAAGEAVFPAGIWKSAEVIAA